MGGLLQQVCHPPVTPAGSAALSPARPDALGAGGRMGMFWSPAPGRTRGWARLRFKQMRQAALLPRHHGTTDPQPPAARASQAPSNPHHLPYSTSYYLFTLYILLRVTCISIVRKPLPPIGDVGKAVQFLCTIISIGPDLGNIKENEHSGTEGSGTSPSSAPRMLHRPTPAAAAVSGARRRAGAGKARPDPCRGERCGSVRCYHSMREISGNP